MNINGWDTICVIAADYINTQLGRNLGQLIQTFDYSATDPFAGPYTIKGTFGPWQLVPGGSNTLVHMNIPITSGSVTLASGASTDISGMAVVVEISLNLLPAQSDQSLTQLTFNFQQAGKVPGDTTPGLVTPVTFSDPNNTGKGSFVETAVVQVLIANAREVSFVFATIGLVQPNVNTWLRPVKSAYTYTQPVGQGSGYLSILSVTLDREISGLSTELDTSLISSSFLVSIAISSDLFLQNVVMPMLPSALPNTDASTFKFVPGVGIQNTRSFPTPGVTAGAITYHPQVDSLTISSTDNYLANSVQGSCGLDMPNASMDFTVAAKNVLSYNAANNTLSYQPDPNPTTSHTNNIPWYDYILIALTGGIGLAIFAIVVPIIANEIANTLNSSNSSGITLTQTPPQTVQWQGMQNIQVGDAGLNDLFYLRGHVVPAAQAMKRGA